MLHHVHQLVSNCVCLQFGIGDIIGCIDGSLTEIKDIKNHKLHQKSQKNELKDATGLF